MTKTLPPRNSKIGARVHSERWVADLFLDQQPQIQKVLSHSLHLQSRTELASWCPSLIVGVVCEELAESIFRGVQSVNPLHTTRSPEFQTVLPRATLLDAGVSTGSVSGDSEPTHELPRQVDVDD